MTLATVAEISAAPSVRLDWSGSYAALSNGSVATGFMATPQGSAAWGNGSNALPFASPADAAGENPTGYTFQGRWYDALPFDGVIREIGLNHSNSLLTVFDLLWLSQITAVVAATPVTFTGQPTLPARDLNGASAGVACWAVVWTESSSSTFSCTYTNSAGTAGRSSGSVANNASSAGGPYIFPLANGDQGVRVIQSVTSSATTNIMVAIVRRLARVQGDRFIAGAAAPPGIPIQSSASPVMCKVQAGAVLFPTMGISNITSVLRSSWATVALDVP